MRDAVFPRPWAKNRDKFDSRPIWCFFSSLYSYDMKYMIDDPLHNFWIVKYTFRIASILFPKYCVHEFI
jgi:hypothetical protein